MTTELVKGMTLDEALEVTRKDVAEALDGLPPDQDALLEPGRRRAARRDQELARRHPPRADHRRGGGAPLGGCDVPGLNEIENADDYVGIGVYKQVDDIAELEGKRVLVLDKGPATAKLALELTKVTPRVVFLTELDTLGLPEELVDEIKRSDVKVLYKSRLLSVGGEGEVEKVRVHDLDEENEYDLFVDAVVLLGA